MTSVLVLHNDPVLPPGHPDYESEQDVLETVAAVAGHLNQAGFAVSRLGIADDPAPLLAGLRDRRPDVVFNLYEGTGNRGNAEIYVTGLLEWLRVPFTGSPAQALTFCHAKHLTKHIFQAAGVPTPDFFTAETAPVAACPLGWPVIVKPPQEHASVGLDQGSVVTNLEQLNARVGQLLDRFGPPVLVEQFVRGRELNVALIEGPELRMLPISEILFLDPDPAHWPIVTYDAKWKTGSFADEATPARCPAEVAPALAAQLEAAARKAFLLMGCRDYARFDFRVSEAGQPFLLEANPNPGFNPGAGFTRGLVAAGLSHAQFTVQLVRNALARVGRA